MLNDPTFKADAQKRGADLLPMSGEELGAYVGQIETGIRRGAAAGAS